jgi:hypothetical protein
VLKKEDLQPACFMGRFLRYIGPACRAVQCIIPYPLVPGSEPYADGRFGIVDPAVDLPVIGPVIERAVSKRSAIGIDPVIDAGHPGDIGKGKIPAGLSPASRKPDPDMPEDILAIIPDPRDEILRDPFLAPSPFLAAPAALQAILDVCHDIPGFTQNVRQKNV